jgi:hypothetical protein
MKEAANRGCKREMFLGLENQGNPVGRWSCFGDVLRHDLPQLRAGRPLQTSLRAGWSKYATRE